MHLDLVSLLRTTGYLGLFSIIFTESGLLVGFFLPGDSLLASAGILAGQGFLNIYLVILLTVIAAILGDSTGYWLGKRFGPRLFTNSKARLFKPDHLKKAHDFYDKNGGKTIVLARFIPAIRTFAPLVAGTGQMPYSEFLFFNIAGGIGWAISLPLLGYFLGKSITNIDHYVLPIVGGIILLSILPSLVGLIRRYYRKKAGTTG